MPEEYFEEQLEPYVKKRRSSTAAFKLQYHIVFATKYRKPILKEEVALKLKEVIIETCQERGYMLLALSIIIDHVHIILDLKPTEKLSEVIQYLKGKSSFTLLKAFPVLKDFIGKNNLWSDGYSVDSLGRANVAQVKVYLDRQEDHHSVSLPDESGGSAR